MLVMKFGGASFESADSFLRIAQIIKERQILDKKIVVVVSAMAKETDRLLELALKVHPNPPSREQDMLVSVGERISMSLLAMALLSIGVNAVSFTGSQSGIITCENHSNAQIVNVIPNRVQKALDRGAIAIVAGFQGVSRGGEITTLGRGGSDTSAVALAIALGAKVVEFYKDVAGIFNEDPKKNLQATIFPTLSFQEALEISLKGAKVLHPRCISLAKNHGIQLAIRSLMNSSKIGTLVGDHQKVDSKICYEVSACSLS